jgi:hypothetical protein
MVVHACNSSTWEVEDLEFEASLDYIARSCLKKKKNQIVLTIEEAAF